MSRKSMQSSNLLANRNVLIPLVGVLVVIGLLFGLDTSPTGQVTHDFAGEERRIITGPDGRDVFANEYLVEFSGTTVADIIASSEPKFRMLKAQLKTGDKKRTAELTAVRNEFTNLLQELEPVIRQKRIEIRLQHTKFDEELAKKGIQIEKLKSFEDAFNGVHVRKVDKEFVRDLENIPGVVAVHPNYVRRLVLAQSVPLIGADSQALSGLTDPNGKAINGEGITIAVIDTGVDYTHPDLGGCVGDACKVISLEEVSLPGDGIPDDHGHGTHVASTAAGLKGVAPGAKIAGFDVGTSGNAVDMVAVVDSVNKAIQSRLDPNPIKQIDIISLSLGGHGYVNDPDSRSLDRAVSNGIVAVVAAGNEGKPGVVTPDGYSTIGSPGASASAITVGAVDDTTGNTVATFSSKGPVYRMICRDSNGDGVIERSECTEQVATDVPKPDVVAPGVSITAAVPTLRDPSRYATWDGTSMATPHVSGLAALMLQANPALSPVDVKRIILEKARLLSGYDANTQGKGVIRAKDAVDDAIRLRTGAVPPPPPTGGGGTTPPSSTPEYDKKIPILTSYITYPNIAYVDTDTGVLIGVAYCSAHDTAGDCTAMTVLCDNQDRNPKMCEGTTTQVDASALADLMITTRGSDMNLVAYQQRTDTGTAVASPAFVSDPETTTSPPPDLPLYEQITPDMCASNERNYVTETPWLQYGAKFETCLKNPVGKFGKVGLAINTVELPNDPNVYSEIKLLAWKPSTTVTPPPAPPISPDFDVISINAPPDAVVGQAVAVTVDVQNIKQNSVSGIVSVRVEQGDGRTFDAKFAGAATTNLIAGNPPSRTDPLSLTYLGAGTFTITAHIDYAGSLEEMADKTNNVETKQIIVTPPTVVVPPDVKYEYDYPIPNFFGLVNSRKYAVFDLNDNVQQRLVGAGDPAALNAPNAHLGVFVPATAWFVGDKTHFNIEVQKSESEGTFDSVDCTSATIRYPAGTPADPYDNWLPQWTKRHACFKRGTAYGKIGVEKDANDLLVRITALSDGSTKQNRIANFFGLPNNRKYAVFEVDNGGLVGTAGDPAALNAPNAHLGVFVPAASWFVGDKAQFDTTIQDSDGIKTFDTLLKTDCTGTSYAGDAWKPQWNARHICFKKGTTFGKVGVEKQGDDLRVKITAWN